MNGQDFLGSITIQGLTCGVGVLVSVALEEAVKVVVGGKGVSVGGTGVSVVIFQINLGLTQLGYPRSSVD
jgi:hypothetical protein